MRCPKCNAKLIDITCLGDTHWQYLCTDCGAKIEGELIDPARDFPQSE